MREMTAECGAFTAALDAESEGVEGRFYVWSKAEIEALLDPQATALFCQTYDVREDGNQEGSNVLHRLNSMDPLPADMEASLAASRAILFREREQRQRPARDDKILADWNGLMIRAIVRAAQCFDRDDWIICAERAFAFISTHMTGRDGRLFHSHCAGKTKEISLLDDHVHMIGAALALHEAKGEPDYLARAIEWAGCLETLFADAENGGYFTDAHDADALILRIRSVHDSALPSANGRLLEIFAQLWHITGDARWLKRAERQVSAFAGEAARAAFPLAAFLNGYDSLNNMVETTIFGARDDPEVAALIRAHHAVSLPAALLRIIDDDTALPDGHPATNAQISGASAIVCADRRCSLPLKTPEALKEALIRARVRS